MKKSLRWLAATAMTWLLATTILASLVARPGVGSPSFAVILNMVLPMWIVGVFAIADPDLDHPWLAPYFETRRWERDGRRYKNLGVLRYQAVLKKHRIGVFGLRPRDFRVTPDATFVEKMERETRAAEAAHGACFLVVAGFAAFAAATGRIAGAIGLVAVGAACQVYPMLLQRYHRPRWRRVLTRARSRCDRTIPAGIVDVAE
jgi:hypothetical protein